MANLTPMMQQFLNIKKQYADCILFFRLGDFYEMFFEDAEIASKELEITLTGKDCGLKDRAPMCGVPYHSSDLYISRLISKGYKVAICEQVEDPKEAKGIVKRDVIRIVTPGTLTDSSMLDEKKNNYLMCIFKDSNGGFGIAVSDVSTGEFTSTYITQFMPDNKIMDEIAKYAPTEIILSNTDYEQTDLAVIIKNRFNLHISQFDSKYFNNRLAREVILSKFPKYEPLARTCDGVISAVGALLQYLNQTQKVSLFHIQDITYYQIETNMLLDVSTRRNLELVETLREKSRKWSLLWVLDRSITSMGSREIRKWIERPLINVSDIQERLDAVEALKDDFMARTDIRSLLKKVYDIERLLSKIVIGSVNCRELNALKISIVQIPEIKKILSKFDQCLNLKIYDMMDELFDIYTLIDSSICEDPPTSVKEGGIIKLGYSAEIDKLKEASTNGKVWIADLEAKEKHNTGIKNLKIGFNKVFGYYIEITKSNYSLVPGHYVRRQTLANCERYITQDLKEIEEVILGAETRLIDLEYQEFVNVRTKISEQIGRIKNTAVSITLLDVICALAEVAHTEAYTKPEVHVGTEIQIIDGRHPVVEKVIGLSNFVPNDTVLDTENNKFNILTGPNMSGKSTYMRQIALIVLMGQIGSFVPARSAKIGAVDRIFTRVGASDDLASGQSTFMLEMSEVANILKNATAKSLMILDEIGRGTSTFDGLSIAWAVVEFVNEQIGSRALFATHYHELTELEGKIKGVKNYCISAEERGEDIIFLRKIMRGGADESYGIQVAQLAGVPQDVISRANEILRELEDTDLSKREKRISKRKQCVNGQLSLFDPNEYDNKRNAKHSETINQIKKLDLAILTPIEALNVLYDFQEKLKSIE